METMLYTALGDSITFGENASSFARSYPRLAVASLSSRTRKVVGNVVARPGWTSEDLWRAVKGNPGISRSGIVSVWIGGVDMADAALASVATRNPPAIQQALSNYRQNLSQILGHLEKTSRARIICFTQYNPFPNSSIAVAGIRALNQTTMEVARRHRVSIAPAHKWFEGRQASLIYGYREGKVEDALSGFMPIHPNDRGHQVIASGLIPYLDSGK
ncbi:Lysophospholipase L1 [Paenibacillus sp. RU4T]|nr:Lysophospholipase L1 [Paenibacillus sp. RU4X]SIR54387.1 Lysophospholipase L1 [Paenibacillus sp. RU4T]